MYWLMQRTLIQNGVVFTWVTKYMHVINIRFNRQAFPYIHNFIMIQLDVIWKFITIWHSQNYNPQVFQYHCARK